MKHEKYKLIKEPCTKLFRVKALRKIDTSQGIVNPGDVGGLVEGYHNLDETDNSWVFEEAKVKDKAFVTGNSSISGHAIVQEKARINASSVRGCATVSGSSIIEGGSLVMGFSKVLGNSRVLRESSLLEGPVIKNSTIEHTTVRENSRVLNGSKLSNSFVSGSVVVGNSFFSKEPLPVPVKIEKSSAVFLSDLVSFPLPFCEGSISIYRCGDSGSDEKITCSLKNSSMSFLGLELFFEFCKRLIEIPFPEVEIPKELSVYYKYITDNNFEKIKEDAWTLTDNLLSFCEEFSSEFKKEVYHCLNFKTKPLYFFFFSVLVTGSLMLGSSPSISPSVEDIKNLFNCFESIPTDFRSGRLCFENAIVWSDDILKYVSSNISADGREAFIISASANLKNVKAVEI